jgi:hypothetical protein
MGRQLGSGMFELLADPRENFSKNLFACHSVALFSVVGGSENNVPIPIVSRKGPTRPATKAGASWSEP